MLKKENTIPEDSTILETNNQTTGHLVAGRCLLTIRTVTHSVLCYLWMN